MNKGLVIFFYVVLAAASGGCYSQPQDAKEQHSTTASEINVSVVKQFSKSLAAKDKEKFVSLLAPQGLQIYRGFASGNLGGRGESLAKTFIARDIKSDLTIDVKGQTPLDFPWLFPELVAQGGDGLTVYPFTAGIIDVQSPSKTLVKLQELLTAKPELVDGVPLLLSADGTQQVVVEAQSIGGVLVGGFAIFESSRLIAIWDIR